MSSDSGHNTRPAWIVVAILLAGGIVVPLLVPIYDTVKPTLFGFPFYYWFQFALIPVVSILTYLAFKIAQTATARDRRARGLGAQPSEGSARR
jgi:hypothetical protein